MPLMIPIVEGHGDCLSVPLLLRRILYERCKAYEWRVTGALRAGKLAHLRKRLEHYLRLAEIRAAQEREQGATLILLDLDDGCPKEEAQELAAIIRAAGSKLPVAIVFAHREFETWILAGMEELAPRSSRSCSGDGEPREHVEQRRRKLPGGRRDPATQRPAQGSIAALESIRDAKGRVSRLIGEEGPYKETVHQAKLTARIDLAAAEERSRSFRRLLGAVEFLIEHRGCPNVVSP
jgi:hypothetical protein